MMRKDRSFFSKALAATVPTLKDPAFFEVLVDDAMKMAEPAWIGNAEALSSFDVSERTPEFVKPVMVLWGRSDYIVTRSHGPGLRPGRIRKVNSRSLKGVGHSVIAEDPARFLDLLRDFTARF